MKPRAIAIIVAIGLSLYSTASRCQSNQKSRIALTSRSNVSTSEIGKELDHHCPNVSITDDPQRADYTLEAWDTGAGPGRKPYKFTLFKAGDRVFSTETRGVAGAVKDVCTYIAKPN